MRKVLLFTSLSLCGLALAASKVSALTMTAPHPLKPQTPPLKPQVTEAQPRFTFTDASGKQKSIDVVTQYQPDKITQPFARVDRRLDPKLMRAATIAEERAHAHSRSRCWHYVKEALVAAGAVTSRPKTEYAKQAGQELVSNYGFKKLAVQDPYQAPVGSVLVYGARRAAGHVEIRTQDGFVSDFRSKTPSRRPLLGVFIKG